MQLRDYQIDIAERTARLIWKYKIAYLAMQTRTGKTLTALKSCDILKANKILFITKKKAIPSILSDYANTGYEYHLDCVNYESLHKVKGAYDVIIADEAHSCFTGNTLIDGIKINDIKVGDLTKSYNFAKDIVEYKRVSRVYKKALNKNLVKIKCNGKEIVCTEDHKIYTQRGWIEAGQILPTDEMLEL